MRGKRRSAPRRRGRRAVRVRVRLDTAGTARHVTSRPCVVEPGVSRGIAQANSAPRDDRLRARERLRACALHSERNAGGVEEAAAPHKIRRCDDSKRRPREPTAAPASPSDWSNERRPEEDLVVIGGPGAIGRGTGERRWGVFEQEPPTQE